MVQVQIGLTQKTKKSVIAHYVEDICLFDNPEIISKGFEAPSNCYFKINKANYPDGAIIFGLLRERNMTLLSCF